MNARPPHKPLDPTKAVHAAWLAVMRAAIACNEGGAPTTGEDLENICLELHFLHESLLKRGTRLRTPQRLTESSSAQLRITDQRLEI